jgi:hypothetical protein
MLCSVLTPFFVLKAAFILTLLLTGPGFQRAGAFFVIAGTICNSFGFCGKRMPHENSTS